MLKVWETWKSLEDFGRHGKFRNIGNKQLKMEKGLFGKGLSSAKSLSPAIWTIKFAICLSDWFSDRLGDDASKASKYLKQFEGDQCSICNSLRCSKNHFRNHCRNHFRNDFRNHINKFYWEKNGFLLNFSVRHFTSTRRV